MSQEQEGARAGEDRGVPVSVEADDGKGSSMVEVLQLQQQACLSAPLFLPCVS